jgi:hypothetical protein
MYLCPYHYISATCLGSSAPGPGKDLVDYFACPHPGCPFQVWVRYARNSQGGFDGKLVRPYTPASSQNDYAQAA